MTHNEIPTMPAKEQLALEIQRVQTVTNIYAANKRKLTKENGRPPFLDEHNFNTYFDINTNVRWGSSTLYEVHIVQDIHKVIYRKEKWFMLKTCDDKIIFRLKSGFCKDNKFEFLFSMG